MRGQFPAAADRIQLERLVADCVVMPAPAIVLGEETADATNDEFNGVFVDGIAGDTLTFDAFNIDVTAGSETVTALTADEAIFASAWGKSPSYFGFIPFVGEDNPKGWLDTSLFGKPTVIHTNGNAAGAAYVSIQEVRNR